MSKCDNCVFRDVYRDMGASVPVCTHPAYPADLSQDAKRCDRFRICLFRQTKEQVLCEIDRTTDFNREMLLLKLLHMRVEDFEKYKEERLMDKDGKK